MKRKRAFGGQKRKTTTPKSKPLSDVMNDEAGESEADTRGPPVGKSLPNERTDATAASLHLEKYPSALREMIVSVIKEMSKEAGGLANLSRSLVDSPIGNGGMAQPHVDMGLEGNKSPLCQNTEYKERELKAALTVIKKTMRLDAADPFNRPVDPVALEIPDYFDVIDTPMDFGTICSNLENGLKYMNSADVYKDVQHIWYNCIKYNKKGDHILELLDRVKTVFMKHWIASGLETEQTTSIVEPSLLQHSMHDEEHSGSYVTPVAGNIVPNHRPRLSSNEQHHAPGSENENNVAPDPSILREKKIENDYPLDPLASILADLQQIDAGSSQSSESDTMPVNMIADQPEHNSSGPDYSPESDDEPDTDSPTTQKKRHGRGPTRCLKLLNTPGRIKVVTNDLGQPVGREAALLTSFLGLTARDGNMAPLIYSSWSKVPHENKEIMWQKVLEKFDIDPSNQRWVLRSLGTKWRNFKSLLKAAHYDTHMTDEERLADCDERVLPDQWAVLVSQWSSEKWQRISAKNKANRARQRFYHTSGQKSFARIREEERAKRPDGKELSRAELFILTRTRKNGQPVNEETAAVISKLRESETNMEQTGNKNEPQDETLNRLIGADRKGDGSLIKFTPTISPSVPEIPSRAEALKMVSEKNAEVVEMKEKLASVEETCSQMAAQMAAMMSMMANMQKASSGENFQNDVGGTSVQMSIPHHSEPISTSHHDVPSKMETRGRKKRA